MIFPMLIFSQSEKQQTFMIQVEICIETSISNCLQVDEDNWFDCEDCKKAVLGKNVDKKDIILEDGSFNEKKIIWYLENMISKYSAKKPKLEFMKSEDLDEITYRYYSYMDKEGRPQMIGVVLPSY